MATEAEKAEAEKAAAQKAAEIEEKVGHPGERWDALCDRVQAEAVTKFGDIAQDWLGLMWCLDAYRREEVPPLGMGKPDQPPARRLEGVYRGKGNFFATALSLLLDNRTGERIRSRGQIDGFSQQHQIDLAWPDRKVAPVVCAESKLSGAPAYGDTRARGATDDFSNRRKELKFAATDLKLGRRDQNEAIGHWDVWRRSALPKCFALWAGRLSEDDKIEQMVREAEAIVATYLDGAGIVAWRENAAGTGYELVKMPKAAPGLQVVELDNALWQVESEIKLAKSQGLDQEPTDEAAPIDPDKLEPDEEE